jgi:hypothetical protein
MKLRNKTLNNNEQILVPLSIPEIREIINALKERISIKATLKTQLLAKLHYHEDWFPTLKKVSSSDK